MTTDKASNPNNSMSAPEEKQRKEALDKKTSVQFTTSVAIGVLVIILVAASAYFGIIRF